MPHSTRSRCAATLACIGAAALTTVVPATAAGEEFDLYGRVNVTVQHSDDGIDEQGEVKSNASRVGVKGGKELRDGLQVVYQLEWGVNIDSGADEDHITPRNQFIGLEGAFGTIKVGRHDTALKESQGEFDLFDDLEGDIARVFNGENRLKDYIGYTTPTIADALEITVNFFPGEDPQNGEDGMADAGSIAAVYETEFLYVAIAHDRDVDGEDVRTTRLIGGHTFGPAKVMLLYQRTDGGEAEEDGLGASLAWTFGQYVARLQYLDADIWRFGPGDGDPRLASSYSLGLDREFGEDTRLFAFYTGGEIGGSAEDVGYIAVGIEHKF